MKIFALIKNGFVWNTIVVEDLSFLERIRNDYNHIIEISQEPGNPSIGWSYDANSQTFFPPAPEPEPETEPE